MKKLFLSLLLLLSAHIPTYAADCECQLIEYEDLLSMPISELRAKVEQYERLKANYANGGSTYCFYTCATTYEQLWNAKAGKERDQMKSRAANRAQKQDAVLQPPPPSRR
ncbi:hypothetical protein M1B72_15065 [Geomonas paludis]|uniref:Uncharacterized protein n=1 Tax=Geomonas paludis TaxID=2740185 RepID=A0ABY4LE74_9BACT|nr:hypothetical protein [Geomonas paludis]UPU34762.1 hypothetical protein M1B72_15065 [Geomonas paludis]